MKGLGDRSACLIAIDEENSKVNYVSCVADNFKGVLSANLWAEQIANIIGGKSGGSKNTAQGAGQEVGKVDEALKLAKEFANKCAL